MTSPSAGRLLRPEAVRPRPQREHLAIIITIIIIIIIIVIIIIHTWPGLELDTAALNSALPSSVSRLPVVARLAASCMAASLPTLLQQGRHVL